MGQRAPYIVIGLLLGIVVAQWAVPAAQSQTEFTLRANAFELIGGGQYVYTKARVRPSRDCMVSFTEEISQPCKCGDGNCEAGKFCYDDGCHSKSKYCKVNGLEPLDADCDCAKLDDSGVASATNPCTTGKFCLGTGECADDPSPKGFDSVYVAP